VAAHRQTSSVVVGTLVRDHRSQYSILKSQVAVAVNGDTNSEIDTQHHPAPFCDSYVGQPRPTTDMYAMYTTTRVRYWKVDDTRFKTETECEHHHCGTQNVCRRHWQRTTRISASKEWNAISTT